ncbi:MAG: hypothetical protein LBR24_04120, partial [Methanobrevibacter sp.]|nr:hypothetical protein [Methanobrevibacter sp.]
MNKKKSINSKKVIQKSINEKKSIKDKNLENDKSKEEYIFKDINLFPAPFTDNSERHFLMDNYDQVIEDIRKRNDNFDCIDPLDDYLVKKALLGPATRQLYIASLNAVFEDLGFAKIKSIEFKGNTILASLYGQKDIEMDSHVIADEKF